jgi:hypothetical protein
MWLSLVGLSLVRLRLYLLCEVDWRLAARYYSLLWLDSRENIPTDWVVTLCCRRRLGNALHLHAVHLIS